MGLSRRRPGKWAVWRFNWLANHKIIRALERARAHAHGTLLDVGCGSRAFAPLFDGCVSRYLGLDLKDAPYPDTTPEVYGRAEALPLRSGSVNTVLGLALLTYLPDPMDMLRESHRVLAPGGVLLVEFPYITPERDPMRHRSRFTREGAAAMLDRAGFDAVAWLPIGGPASRVGLRAIGALNRINRGSWRVITELPVRALYVVLQVGFELLDHVVPDPDGVLAHLVVARRRANGAAPRPDSATAHGPDAPGSGS